MYFPLKRIQLFLDFNLMKKEKKQALPDRCKNESLQSTNFPSSGKTDDSDRARIDRAKERLEFFNYPRWHI